MKEQYLALQYKYLLFHIITETVQFINHSFVTETQ